MARVETRESSWSFDQIYDEYKIPIYNYVYHLVGDREQADDLTQDTFLKAFRALPKMDANLKLSAWLYRIATNTAYDALRRRKLIAWLPWQDLDHEPADGESADPQEIYVQQNSSALLYGVCRSSIEQLCFCILRRAFHTAKSLG